MDATRKTRHLLRQAISRRTVLSLTPLARRRLLLRYIAEGHSSRAICCWTGLRRAEIRNILRTCEVIVAKGGQL